MGTDDPLTEWQWPAGEGEEDRCNPSPGLLNLAREDAERRNAEREQQATARLPEEEPEGEDPFFSAELSPPWPHLPCY